MTIGKLIRQLRRKYVLKYNLESYWQINCGLCRHFALTLQKQFTGNVVWGNELAEEDEEGPWSYHCFFEHAGEDGITRYYDSESPDGELDWRELKCFLDIDKYDHIDFSGLLTDGELSCD